jgi:hypothetical protein
MNNSSLNISLAGDIAGFLANLAGNLPKGLQDRGGQRMGSHLVSMFLCLNIVVACAANAGELPDLKVTKVEIIPNSVEDARQDPTFKPEAIIEAAAAEAGGNSKKSGDVARPMRMYRSYRFIVTIRNVGKVPVTDTFIVRTECVRDGKEPIVLGKTRIAMMDGVVFACFDVFPSSGGKGECVIRTIVDAENQVNEVDERASSNTLDFKARIQE